jgi:hypothetical protein
MTCAHVLGLIDAGPFADYPRAHLDVAWQHARRCATCGPALEAATALTTNLAGLPQPPAPPELTAAVLARIAQIERPHFAPAAEMAETRAGFKTEGGIRLQPDLAGFETSRRALSGARDWPAWAAAPGGLAAGFVIALSMASGDGALIDISSSGVGGMTAGLFAMLSTTTWMLVLAASLALYAAGLFAPLGAKGS